MWLLFPADPSPSPSIDITAGQQDLLSTVAIPLVSAILGSVLTLFGEWLFRVRSDGHARSRLIRLLRDEVQRIQSTAQERSESEEEVSLVAPLPSNAWTSFQASRFLDSISSSLLESLTHLYDAVEAANAITRSVPLLLQTSALSVNQETVRAFRQEAIRFSREPYLQVATDAEQVVAQFANSVGKPL